MSIEIAGVHVRVGEKILQSRLVEQLHEAHYELTHNVVQSGQFSRHGDRLSVFAVNAHAPIHIDFLGGEIERIVSVEDKSSKTEFEKFQIAPNYLDADGLRFHPGEYVVHLDHGIGRFRGLGMREVGSMDSQANMSPYSLGLSVISKQQRWSHYLILEYADGAEIFVPPEQVQKITHYVGARTPTLSRLGGKRWQAIKKKVEDDLFKLAKDLLLIAAERELHPRPPYVIQQDWIEHVAQQFPYEATDDQQKAISAVLTDLVAAKPMDRLVCGDVGFGKTEVAIRAATGVISAGRQVALLAPTTLLVSQHAATFKNRLSSLPVRLSSLSRFVSETEQHQIVNDAKEGKVDLVIGTHRLLQTDVGFRDLGLVIIDEEQKFGVKHKEQLKKLRAQVDVLTLSATPIPRTLFIGLSGLRDISLIMTPPKNRLPIETHILKSDDQVVAEAIKKELNRGGQVFVLHNDVSSIEARARQIRELVKEASVAVAHGQMPEEALARTMARVIEGTVDVLVTSTIIESGLDMPNVNTLIVEKSDRFGLSDLYQIRGRIGRSNVQAYAYFLYDTKELSRAAQMRFQALKESQELGSGYTIALRDLEIRGGGNVLGKEQHGNMEAVGLSLYTKLLQLMVEKIRK